MKHHIDKIWGWDTEWQINNFNQNLDEFKTSIIFEDHNRIGYIQFNTSNDAVFINMIILEQDYQSKGIGMKILDLIQSAHRFLPIRLKCFKVNKPALDFYNRNGFVEMKRDEVFITLVKTKKASV